MIRRGESIAKVCTGGRTEQSHCEKQNINKIMERATRTGRIPSIQGNEMFGDFSEVGDYETMLNKINNAKTAFMTLPSKVRKEFDHDAGKFLDFMSQESNIERARELGILPYPTSDEIDQQNPQHPEYQE